MSCDVAAALEARLDSLTKPLGSLGKLEWLVKRYGAIHNTADPQLTKKAIYVFCADHGVTAEGVSQYPAEVTPQMVRNFLRGGAAICVLSRHVGAETVIVDAGVNAAPEPGVVDRQMGRGTRNFAREQAMTRDEAVRCLAEGRALGREASGRFDVVGIGEMGIGNTTSAAALLSAFSGLDPEETAGRGTGVDDAGLRRKIDVVRRALALHRPDPADPVGVLAAVGGFEIGMMAGFLLGASIPVLIDGFIAGAAALVARAIDPRVLERLVFSHRSAERGHRRMLDFLGAEPLLDLDLRLGEGTGAALALGILEAAVKVYREMATFAEARVAEQRDNT